MTSPLAGLNFALYGFQNVMSTYLTCYLDLPAAAGPLTNVFAGLTYVVALGSGVLADGRWGLYKTIVVGSALFFAGNVLLLAGNAVFVGTGNGTALTALSFAGIALFVVGSGGTKACTSAFLGDQFGPSKAQQEKRSRFYSWYYLSIQFGSIGVSLAAPIILQQLPWGAWALFAILGGSFFLFFPIFLYGSRGFHKRAPQGSVLSTFFGVVGSALRRNRHAGPRAAGVHWLESAKLDHSPQLVEDVKSVLRVLLVFTPLPFFWAIFFQSKSDPFVFRVLTSPSVLGVGAAGICHEHGGGRLRGDGGGGRGSVLGGRGGERELPDGLQHVCDSRRGLVHSAGTRLCRFIGSSDTTRRRQSR